MLPASFVQMVHEEKIHELLRDVQPFYGDDQLSYSAEPAELWLSRIGQWATGLVRQQPAKAAPGCGCADAQSAKPCAAC